MSWLKQIAVASAEASRYAAFMLLIAAAVIGTLVALVPGAHL